MSYLLLLLLIVTATATTCTSSSGSTVISTIGTLCSECNFLGYLIIGGICVCVTPEHNPLDNCTANNQLRVWDVEQVAVLVNCDCYRDDDNGYFTSSRVAPEGFTYGDVNPITCDVCCDGYGPPPSTITQDLVDIGVYACTKFGGEDPNTDTWGECGGHGDFKGGACTCHEGWALNVYDSAVDDCGGGSIVYMCTVCAPFKGPPVPNSNEPDFYAPPYCVEAWFPEQPDVP